MSPRIVPWSSTSELHQTFSSLFSSEATPLSQQHAIQIIHVWLSRGNCPHAIESTASLLSLVLASSVAGGSPPNAFAKHHLRLSLSLTLIRFVNTLLDPLQTTYYARSMAVLAGQLGLPLWFVELRHAATHEDLPPLVVLQDAARQALDWLYGNYWLPLINNSGSSSSAALAGSGTSDLPPLEPLITSLDSYKLLTKQSLRDHSVVQANAVALKKVHRAIEGWMASTGSEERGVEGIVEGLCRVGGMIPKAKKKRPTPRASSLPTELAPLWAPLLTRLDETHDNFEDVLVSRLVDMLVELSSSSSKLAEEEKEGSAARTVRAWLVFLSENDDEDDGENASGEGGVREDVIKACLLNPCKGTVELLDLFAAQDPALEARIRPLIQVVRHGEDGSESDSEVGLTGMEDVPNATKQSLGTDEEEDPIAVMQKRLLDLEAMMVESTLPLPATAAPSTSSLLPKNLNCMDVDSARLESPSAGSKGWKVVERWVPVPIGHLPVGGVDALDFA